MADDGIGGSDGFDPMTDQQDMVEGGFRPDPNVEENESNGDEGRLDWLEGADDEIAQYVQSKGFKDPAALAKSYREAESRMRQHDAELERLKEQNQQNEDYIGRLIELAERNQQMGGMQQQQPDPEAEIRQQLAAIGQAYQAGQIDEVGAEIARMQLFQQVINQNNQQLSSQFEEKLQSALGQYVAPLQDRMAHDDLNSAAAEMHEEYGPDVSQEALQLIKSGEIPQDLMNTGKGVRMAYQLAAGKIARQAMAEQRAAMQSETMAPNGRGSQNGGGANAEKAVLEAIFSGGRPDDGL